jgi:probable F420-dependent oxidoreductase
VVYPQIELGGSPDAVRQFGDAAEGLGYTHLVAFDHVLGAVHADREPQLLGPYTEHDPFHDPLMMFAYLAGRTSRLGFVTGVMILPQRQTALVARQVADLDLLSGGRFRLGVGVGWNWVEYDALGQDFHTRGKREEEQIELLRRYWTEPVASFEGRFDRVDRAALVPRPSAPIPIWLGGYGGKAFERAARVGDGFIFGGPIERTAPSWTRLRGMVEAEGRDPSVFGAEAVILTKDGPDRVAEKIDEWIAVDGTHASVNSMSLGFTDVGQHIDYITKVAKTIGL